MAHLKPILNEIVEIKSKINQLSTQTIQYKKIHPELFNLNDELFTLTEYLLQQYNSIHFKLNNIIQLIDDLFINNNNQMNTDKSLRSCKSVQSISTIINSNSSDAVTLGSQDTETSGYTDSYSINSGLAPPDSTDLNEIEKDEDYIPSTTLSKATDNSSLSLDE